MVHQLYQRSLSSSSLDIFHEVDLKSMFFDSYVKTSRATMVAAISLLVKNPEALTKLRDEIDFHVGEGRFISDSDLPKLPYLQYCTIAGYDIPRGTIFDRETVMKEGKMDGFRWIPFGAGRRGCPGSGMTFRVTSLAHWWSNSVLRVEKC
ncbi:hypothetical protein MKX03_019597 [Papaver bracteatum]|nr:hypothetical protein MKX03_019597 [Papaver bracteatum]